MSDTQGQLLLNSPQQPPLSQPYSDEEIFYGTSGPRNAHIAIVGESWGATEKLKQRPFVGATGEELGKILFECGLPSRDELFITNVVSEQPHANEMTAFFYPTAVAKKQHLNPVRGLYPKPNVLRGIELLKRQLAIVKPDIIVGFGNYVLWALTENCFSIAHDEGYMVPRGIGQWRGSQLYADIDGRKIPFLPTYHPAAVFQTWSWRYLIVHDLKTRVPKLPQWEEPKYDFRIRPDSTQVIRNLETLLHYADYPSNFAEQHYAGTTRTHIDIAVDLETRNGLIACIGIAWSKKSAICIPLMCSERQDGYFSFEEEHIILSLLRRLLNHNGVRLIGQNFLYDAQYVALYLGFTPRIYFDTMLLHHVCWPGGGDPNKEKARGGAGGITQKGLSHLSSLYCEHHRYWKDEGKLWESWMGEEQLWIYNCFTPDTQVLDWMCQYRALGQLQVGDKLLTFDEESSSGRYARKLRIASITRKEEHTAKVYRYKLSDGTELKGTLEHKVFVQKYRMQSGVKEKWTSEWRELRNVQVGDELFSIGVPWQPEDSFEAGWLSGVFDGEGTVGITKSGTQEHYARIGFCQKKGTILEIATELLRRRNFDINIKTKNGVEYVDFNGGLSETLRLLGILHPYRLLENFMKGAIQHGWGGFSQLKRASVTEIEYLGEQTVIDISTTAKTFIANGKFVHNCTDCIKTFEVYEVLDQLIDELNLREQADFQMQQANELALPMMLRGVRINKSARTLAALELAGEIERYEQKIETLIPEDVYPRKKKQAPWTSSSKQQMEIFYDLLGIKPVKHRKTGNPTLGKEALPIIARREPIVAPIISKLGDLRRFASFHSATQMPLDPDGRMRCSFNPAGTETFRWSSSENAFGGGGNLQNISKGQESDEGLAIRLPNMRKFFTPDPGYEIAEFDLSGADAQVVAWEANDADLKAAFRVGLKLHIKNARDVYPELTRNMSDDELKATDHQGGLYGKLKRMAHGSNYGGSPKGMAAIIQCAVRDIEEFQERWFFLHPGIKDWHSRTEGLLSVSRSVSNKFGFRIVYFDRVNGLLPQALAWVPQSTVALVCLRGALALKSRFSWMEFLLQVHDSIVVQYPVECRRYLPEVKSVLHSVTVPYDDPLIIPWGGTASTKSWGDCKKIEGW